MRLLRKSSGENRTTVLSPAQHALRTRDGLPSRQTFTPRLLAPGSPPDLDGPRDGRGGHTHPSCPPRQQTGEEAKSGERVHPFVTLNVKGLLRLRLPSLAETLQTVGEEWFRGQEVFSVLVVTVGGRSGTAGPCVGGVSPCRVKWCSRVYPNSTVTKGTARTSG